MQRGCESYRGRVGHTGVGWSEMGHGGVGGSYFVGPWWMEWVM